MADLCFICEKLLSEGDFVNVVRGLKTLKTASIERNDGHINFLNTLTSVNVHVECRKVYISKNSIAASKRRLEEDQPLPSPSVPRKKRNEVFDFKKLCLFCIQTADEAAESRKKEKYRRTISNVSTLEFKDNVIKRAEERKDSLGESVKDRLLCEYDLIAVEAKYHTVCYTNFLNRAPSTEKKLREANQVTEAMKEIFCYIENHEDSQFTLKELKDVLKEYVPDDKTINQMTTILPPAPDELLNTLFCNCKNGCGPRCGCRKSGLQCTLACGQYNGQACINAVSLQSDFEKESAFDPEILEGLETTIQGNENDDDETEIPEWPEDDDEEEN